MLTALSHSLAHPVGVCARSGGVGAIALAGAIQRRGPESIFRRSRWRPIDGKIELAGDRVLAEPPYRRGLRFA
jgi:hypothetical protein